MRQRETHVWSGKLKNLRPILVTWTRLQRRALDELSTPAQPDCAWWYNERASIGTLAASCWLSGGTALEEYSDTKGSRKSGDYSGRCDLYMCRGGHEYQVEAKHHWCRMELSASMRRNRLADAMKRARADLHKVKVKDPAIRGLAVVFAVAMIRESDPLSMARADSDWENLVNSADVDALACVQPTNGWKLCYKGRVYPSVALLIKHL